MAYEDLSGLEPNGVPTPVALLTEFETISDDEFIARQASTAGHNFPWPFGHIEDSYILPGDEQVSARFYPYPLLSNQPGVIELGRISIMDPSRGSTKNFWFALKVKDVVNDEPLVTTDERTTGSHSPNPGTREVNNDERSWLDSVLKGVKSALDWRREHPIENIPVLGEPEPA